MCVDLEVVGADDARDDVGVLTTAQVRDPPQAPRRVQQHLYKIGEYKQHLYRGEYSSTYTTPLHIFVYIHMERAR